MLALCLMLSATYYAQNNAGIVGLGQALKLHQIQKLDYENKFDVCSTFEVNNAEIRMYV